MCSNEESWEQRRSREGKATKATKAMRLRIRLEKKHELPKVFLQNTDVPWLRQTSAQSLKSSKAHSSTTGLVDSKANWWCIGFSELCTVLVGRKERPELLIKNVLYDKCISYSIPYTYFYRLTIKNFQFDSGIVKKFPLPFQSRNPSKFRKTTFLFPFTTSTCVLLKRLTCSNFKVRIVKGITSSMMCNLSKCM